MPLKIPLRVTEEVYDEAEKDYKMLHLAESVNENDVSALGKVEESIFQAVAKEGSSTEVYEETVRKKSPTGIFSSRRT